MGNMRILVVLLMTWTGTLAGQTLDGDAFTAGLMGIAEEASLPGAYKGKVAITFANYYNTTVRQYPTELVKINALTNRVADAFSITFTLNGSTMESAQFPVREPDPEPESGPGVNEEAKSDSAQASEPTSVLEAEFASDREERDRQVTTVAAAVELDKIYMVVDDMPRFPGCEDMVGEQEEKYSCAQKKLLEYIYSTVIYPEEARASRIEGSSLVRFSVQKDGSISDIVIAKSLGYGIDEASIAVVESMNHMGEKWTPGVRRGKPVVVQFTLPIKFKLITPKN